MRKRRLTDQGKRAEKVAKMAVADTVKAGNFIRIEQAPMQDVWDIKRKGDGVFVLKKIIEDAPGISNAPQNEGVIELNKLNEGASGTSKATPQPVSILNIPNVVPKEENVIIVERGQVTATLNSSETSKTETMKSPENASTNKVASTRSSTRVRKKGVITMVKTNPSTVEIVCVNRKEAPKNNLADAPINTKRNAISVDDFCAESVYSPKTSNQLENARKSNEANLNLSTFSTPVVFPVTNNAVAAKCIPSTSKYKITMPVNPSNADVVYVNTVKSEKKISPAPTNVAADLIRLDKDSIYIKEQALVVYEMFPNIKLAVILQDLRTTKSTEVTIDNILEGRLVSPPIDSISSSGEDVFVSLDKQQKNIVAQIDSDSSSGEEVFANLVKQQKNSIKQMSLTGKHKIDKNIRKADVRLSYQEKPSTSLKISISNVSQMLKVSLLKKNKPEEQPAAKEIIVVKDSVIKGNSPKKSPLAVAKPMEVTFDSDFEDEELNDSLPFMKTSKQGGPLSLVSYSQVENKLSETSDTAYDDSAVQQEPIKFSDDENDDGETIESLLFRASFVLQKRFQRLKFGSGTKSALLNITGSVQIESDEQMDDCTIGDNSTNIVEGCAQNMNIDNKDSVKDNCSDDSDEFNDCYSEDYWEDNCL